MDANMSGVEEALGKATMRLLAVHTELKEALPELRGTMAIPSVFIGHGLGSFVASSGMTDDEIMAFVRENLDTIRRIANALTQPDAKA